jgi:hypothetical protein
MDFGNDYVNVYIQRLLAYNNELVSKLMMAESKLMIYDARFPELQKRYDDLVEQVLAAQEAEKAEEEQQAQASKKPQTKQVPKSEAEIEEDF